MSNVNLKQSTNNFLKKHFGSKIKQNFLIKIKDKVFAELGPNIFKYFPEAFSFSDETFVCGNRDSFFVYEICRNIVGVHRCNTMFLTDQERATLQENSEYQDKLVAQVIEQIKIREYSGVFARPSQFIAGDEFLFFPMPYKLFAICIKAESILLGNKVLFEDIFVKIFNRGLSALSLLGDNMFESVYPICRAILEIYLKLLVFLQNPETYQKYKTLSDLELVKGCQNKYPPEFEELYSKRKYRLENSRLNYIHYGFVDDINDYENNNVGSHYSFNYLINYLSFVLDNADYFENIKYYYNFSSSFTHGTSGSGGYPLAHYFNIIAMLTITVEHTYRILCDQLHIETNICDVDVISSFAKDYELFADQRDKCCTEKLEIYYRNLFK